MKTLFRQQMMQTNALYQQYQGMVPPNQHYPMMFSPQQRPGTHQMLPFKALSELSNRFFNGVNQQQVQRTFYFTQDDLDNVLYGYSRQAAGANVTCMHALSGLKIGEITHGIDRILSQNSSTPSSLMMSAFKYSRTDPPPHDLPPELCICPTSVAGIVHYGVFCRKQTIPKGTRYGPFKGKVVNTSEIKSFDDNSYMWEVFKEGKLSHFIDGRGATGNWMSYVNCARHVSEQNITVVQDGNQLYYEVCRDINPGMEVLVWYSDNYLQFMGIPVTLSTCDTDQTVEEGIEEADSKLNEGEGYQCERCGKVFAYRYYRDKHLKYTRCVDQGDRKFPCHLCSRYYRDKHLKYTRCVDRKFHCHLCSRSFENRGQLRIHILHVHEKHHTCGVSFEKRDRLRIHILHVHEKHRPHKCGVCGKSFSQSSSLNKHMRVHSGERPYKCVYCNKSFTASSILRTHIRQHSGERPFKCKYCGKAFASHAAHDSHVRRTHAQEKSNTCKECGKQFEHVFDLKLHMRVHEGSHLPANQRIPLLAEQQ